MNKGLFEVSFNNCFVDSFNNSMKYLLQQLPEVEIIKEKPDEKLLLMRILSDDAYRLIKTLYDVECLMVTEITDCVE